MADHAIVVGWNKAVRGRETDALEMFNSFIAFFATKIAAQQIASFEPVIMSPHGGDLNGFMLVRGDRNKLDTIKASDEFQDLVTRCLHCVEGFGVIDAWVGPGVQQQMQRWAKFIKK